MWLEEWLPDWPWESKGLERFLNSEIPSPCFGLFLCQWD